MHTSTPLIGESKNLRRSILLRDVTNSITTSNKKRLSNIINQSLTPQTEVDDELERSQRRNEAEIQRRLCTIGSPNRSPQVLNEKEIRDHFQICLKMYAENKISSKNAWNLKIIDYMRTVLYSQGLNKDSLQVAGTSLDVSAKIYGIRVDDIHTEILKLASNMARVNAQREEENEEHGEDGEGGENEDGDKENQGPKKKKKRRMFTGQKMTIAKDPNSLLGDVPKLESVFFQTRMSLESSSVDNLFTNKFPMNHSRYKFMLLSKEKAWSSYDKKDSNVNFETSYPFKISEIRNLQVCTPFSEFQIDEWDPEQEAALAAEKPKINGEINEEVVYDAEGIPIPELDGSIHDLFANDADDNHYESSEEEEEANKVAQDAVLTKKVAHIVDFKPGKNGLRADEYGYNNAIDLMGGMLITQVWAGPSHWKLKYLRRITSRFSGQPEKQGQPKTVKRTKIQPTLIDFNMDTPPFDKSKLYKPKRSRIDECPLKCTLPQVTHFENKMYRSLMLKPVYLKVDRHNDKDGEDPEVRPYNYENPNDSLYCSQIGVDNGINGADDDCDDFQNEEEIAALAQHNFQGENLIAAPELVPKTYIPYALQAKKMDMRKLKVAVWKTLVIDKHNEIIPEDKMYEKEVHKMNFSDIYKGIPSRITEKMKDELSCPLAFVALLHLCNEQNLQLTGQTDLQDFAIEQLKFFQP